MLIFKISYLQWPLHNHEHASQHMCQLQNLGSGPSGGQRLDMVLTELTDIETVLSESGSLTNTLQEMTKLTLIVIDRHVLTHRHTY